MPGLGFVSSSSKKSSLISCIFVVLSQFALAMIPLFFPSSSILSMLAISALVLVGVSAFGRCCRWVLHVSTSAPALVIFNILFIWGVYIAVIREGIPSLKDAVMTLEFVLLMIGLYSILRSDPGIVKYNYSCLDRPNQSSVSNPHDEVEELLTSNVSLELPAIELFVMLIFSSTGQKNLLLFMVILVGFIVVEASYIACASQTMMRSWYTQKVGLEINWKKYPEFQIIDQSQPGQDFPVASFKNPYDKGVMGNIKEFLQLK
ncbi:putative palmitoyltransferase ZDHHC12 isoform X2 [Cinnamomum micranthum f. kanehirae]|uniref:Putative palmitoyltransferase ZDHHC12 isoform X2 n=1 Tax=Cinnamomum micranthum f. kanehirae TaxID=337451 RepID=A0A3S4PVR1_9MAGN|nr:putative palmitoyltransferase ZDHHC12 isoform X2 [Cinnamomum micranthum f. kanehirae]